jgi:hypothetical protein
LSERGRAESERAVERGDLGIVNQKFGQSTRNQPVNVVVKGKSSQAQQQNQPDALADLQGFCRDGAALD